jgi:hypothetical protein
MEKSKLERTLETLVELTDLDRKQSNEISRWNETLKMLPQLKAKAR